MIKQMQIWAIVSSAWLLSGCATSAQHSKNHQSVETTATNANKSKLDLVSKLIKISELDTLSPTEKFNIYFSIQVRKYPHPETTKLTLFEGFNALYAVKIVGSIEKGVEQIAKFTLPQDGFCIRPNEITHKLPSLEKSPEPGSAIIREDDPTKWEFYTAYSIHNYYGYVSYRFANDECLREIGITQKIR